MSIRTKKSEISLFITKIRDVESDPKFRVGLGSQFVDPSTSLVKIVSKFDIQLGIKRISIRNQFNSRNFDFLDIKISFSPNFWIFRIFRST